MEWETYEKKFYHLAKLEDKSDEYIFTCLEYAKKLFKQDLPIIYDRLHFSLLVGYGEEYLIKASNGQSSFYREFSIPKKSGNEFRTISEPLPNLKEIQRWILNEILYKLKPSDYSKAFRLGVSIKDSAKYHRKQSKLLTVDIRDYFGSIKIKKVYLFFKKLGYSKQVSTMLANLCTLNNVLPQGSPTSPMLSNLITKGMDNRIAGLCKKEGIRYTRYADDLTFSGDFQEGYLINHIEEILQSEGFFLNQSKTRVRKQHQRQEVTGIVVNQKLQASKKYRRDFRQQMYYIRKYGLDSHVKKIEFNNELSYLYHMLGKANFIININPKDQDAVNDFAYLKTLLVNKKNDKKNYQQQWG